MKAKTYFVIKCTVFRIEYLSYNNNWCYFEDFDNEENYNRCMEAIKRDPGCSSEKYRGMKRMIVDEIKEYIH